MNSLFVFRRQLGVVAGFCGFCTIVCFSSLGFTAEVTPSKFDVNDVSYLFPPPGNASDAEQLIAADELLADGVSTIWPEKVFESVLTTAPTVKLTESPFRITLREPEAIGKLHTWKVAGIRIDPSAAGTHESSTTGFGSRPQIRLILQPVIVDKSNPNRVQVQDVTAHLVYDIISRASAGDIASGAPDVERFRKILQDLNVLRSKLVAGGISTGGDLKVHPGFQAPEFRAGLKSFLKTHLRSEDLDAVSFMGVRTPEPWIFFAMSKRSDGVFVLLNNHPSLQAEKGQMLKFIGGDPVVPTPKNTTFGDRGVSTAMLFASDSRGRLESLIFTDGRRPDLQSLKLRDVPDIIANPLISHFFNTDCVSCHSESARRNSLRIQSANESIRYKRPEGISGVSAEVLPKDNWNVRNFGWFPISDSQAVATVTQRTANEAAESAAFINRKYFGAVANNVPKDVQSNPVDPVARNTSEPRPEVESVSHALTLIMKIKSEKDLRELVELLNPAPGAADPKSLTPNRIADAMNAIGTVHFARFVLVPEHMELMVITNYDGDFERYIGAFTDAIGPIFDQLLEHMEGAPGLPVSKHQEEFLAYVKKNDRSFGQSSYSAYPQLKVQDILSLQSKASR